MKLQPKSVDSWIKETLMLMMIWRIMMTMVDDDVGRGSGSKKKYYIGHKIIRKWEVIKALNGYG